MSELSEYINQAVETGAEVTLSPSLCRTIWDGIKSHTDYDYDLIVDDKGEYTKVIHYGFDYDTLPVAIEPMKGTAYEIALGAGVMLDPLDFVINALEYRIPWDLSHKLYSTRAPITIQAKRIESMTYVLFCLPIIAVSIAR